MLQGFLVTKLVMFLLYNDGLGYQTLAFKTWSYFCLYNDGLEYQTLPFKTWSYEWAWDKRVK